MRGKYISGSKYYLSRISKRFLMTLMKICNLGVINCNDKNLYFIVANIKNDVDIVNHLSYLDGNIPVIGDTHNPCVDTYEMKGVSINFGGDANAKYETVEQIFNEVISSIKTVLNINNDGLTNMPLWNFVEEVIKDAKTEDFEEDLK